MKIIFGHGLTCPYCNKSNPLLRVARFEPDIAWTDTPSFTFYFECPNEEQFLELDIGYYSGDRVFIDQEYIKAHLKQVPYNGNYNPKLAP